MSTTTCNPAQLASLRDLGPGILGTLITVFLEDTPSVLADLRLAAASDDHWTLGMFKHRLKGSSGIFGADTLVALCDSGGYAADLENWLAAVETEYQRVAAELTQLA